MKHIDTHVHCRDWNESHKTTIRSVTELARKQGIVAIIDKPNTDPPIISMERVENRIKLARLQGCSKGYYLTMGLTNDVNQIKEAAEITTIHPRVVDLKFFAAGKGELAITNEKDQLRVYETLAKCNYRGVLSVHCEKKSLFQSEKFNPKKPWTWNDARPPESEEESVKDQINFAMKTGFQGHLRILHVSSPKTFDVNKYDLSVSFEVTPHHLLFSTDDMRNKNGLDKKVNPPIRKKEVVKLLWKKLMKTVIEDYIPVAIGSDHAPHSMKEKRKPPYLSGYPSLNIYSNLIEEMRNHAFGEREIGKLTYWNAKKIFPKIRE